MASRLAKAAYDPPYLGAMWVASPNRSAAALTSPMAHRENARWKETKPSPRKLERDSCPSPDPPPPANASPTPCCRPFFPDDDDVEAAAAAAKVAAVEGAALALSSAAMARAAPPEAHCPAAFKATPSPLNAIGCLGSAAMASLKAKAASAGFPRCSSSVAMAWLAAALKAEAPSPANPPPSSASPATACLASSYSPEAASAFRCLRSTSPRNRCASPDSRPPLSPHSSKPSCKNFPARFVASSLLSPRFGLPHGLPLPQAGGVLPQQAVRVSQVLSAVPLTVVQGHGALQRGGRLQHHGPAVAACR